MWNDSEDKNCRPLEKTPIYLTESSGDEPVVRRMHQLTSVEHSAPPLPLNCILQLVSDEKGQKQAALQRV